MLTRQEKEKIIADLRSDIEKSQALFVTNLIGVTSPTAVEIRKKVREADGKVVVTRNTLFAKAAKGTYCETLLASLKGPHAVAFAFKDPAAVAKCIKEAGDVNQVVTLEGGTLDGKVLSVAEVKTLANLPSRDQMLGTLLATFNAPISALARVLNSIREQKETA